MGFPTVSVSCLGVFLLCLICRLTVANPVNASATYDQRQNGKVNVHISIKDVAIILNGGSDLGAAEDDVNYGDYDYDYDHLTVKPNGIWATLGQTTAAAAPVNPPPTPAASQSLGFAPVSAQNATELENPEAETAFIQFPQTLDEKPAEQSLETWSEASHPFSDWPSTETSLTGESTEAVVTTKKPGNRTTHKYAWNGDLEEIPVEVIIEPVLKNKQRQRVAPGTVRERQQKRGPKNKFGLDQLIRLISAMDKGDDKDYSKDSK